MYVGNVLHSYLTDTDVRLVMRLAGWLTGLKFLNLAWCGFGECKWGCRCQKPRTEGKENGG